MASPFPGMDPFIESQGFSTLHGSMIFLMQETLQGRLPDGYYAASQERVWIDTATWIEPDVKISRTAKKKSSRSAVTGAAVATLAKPIVVFVAQDDHTENFLEIYNKIGDMKRLVCSIEILSPTNKTPGEKGQKVYRRKQHEILRRRVHLVEIDLLRAGRHTTAVPLDFATADAGEFDYHVCVRRFNRFAEFDVYPILMQQKLPRIAVPLLPADGDIEVDLQGDLSESVCGGAVPAGNRLSHRQDRRPPLTKEQDEWMRDVRAAARRDSTGPGRFLDRA